MNSSSEGGRIYNFSIKTWSHFSSVIMIDKTFLVTLVISLKYRQIFGKYYRHLENIMAAVLIEPAS